MKLIVIKRLNVSMNPTHSHCVKDLDATGVSILFTGSKAECLRYKRNKEANYGC